MLSIKVLGPGCANCVKVAQIAQEAVNYLKVEAQIDKVSENPAILKYGLMATPGLVINEKLVCAGRIPSVAEVTTWLANELV
jgi:small redox-active disulfide protein 2